MCFCLLCFAFAECGMWNVECGDCIGADRRDDIRSVCSETVFCTVQHPTMSSLLFGFQEPNVGDAVVILRYMLTMVTYFQVPRWMM